MSFFKNLYFIETVIQIENIRIRVCVDENILAINEKCIATTHNHSFYELRYYSKGNGEIVIDKEKMKIFPGALYLIHPNEYHYQKDLSIDEGISQYSIRFAPIMPREDASKIQHKAYDSLCRVLSSMHHINDETLSMLPYFEKLVCEIKGRRYGHIGCTTALLALILTDILRRSELDDMKRGMAHTDDFILETDAFFSREYPKKVTLEDYARELNISTRHASRVIRKNFGMTFVQKLTETRIEHAKLDLTKGDESISKIASLCGFQSYGYFVTCFKSHTGKTPSQYRATAIQKDKSKLNN